jgi:hypothetical protein
VFRSPAILLVLVAGGVPRITGWRRGLPGMNRAPEDPDTLGVFPAGTRGGNGPDREAIMAEYERSRLVQASPDDVFAFVSNVGNMAAFVPTVDAAKSEAGGRVHVHGEVRSDEYDDDGWFRVDAGRRRLEWGSDERDYSGWLTVSGEDGGSQVVAHISAAPFVSSSGRPIDGEPAGAPDRYEQGLEAALDSLRNLMEGSGGKEEPVQAG